VLVGSISHTGGMALSVVASCETAIVGVDVEAIMEPKTAALLERKIANDGDLRKFDHMGLSQAEALTVTFSAKETLYKALYPRVRRFFGFRAADVAKVDGAKDGGRLSLALSGDLAPGFGKGMRFEIAFKMCGDRIYTYLVSELD